MSSEYKPELKTISPTEAAQKAEEAIEKNGIKEWPQGSLLKNPKMQIAQTPFTISEEPEEQDGQRILTYIVPFGMEGEHDENGTPLIRLCILLDGENGDFEELTTFGKPIAYLTRERAIAVVASALHVPVDQLPIREAIPIFEPSEISQVRAYPFWKVVVDDRTYYVDQDGKLYNEILPDKGGN